MKPIVLMLTALLVSGCTNYPKGFCTQLVKSYEQCREDRECWDNRGLWGTPSYMTDLNRCYINVAQGKP